MGVFVFNTDGSGLMPIADEAGDPSWSPDGSTIVMVSGGPHVGCGGLAYVAPDGTNRQETGEQGMSPDCSPDGRLVAFAGNSGIRTLDFVNGMTVGLASNPVMNGRPGHRTGSESPSSSRAGSARTRAAAST